MNRRALLTLLRRLERCYGPQHWWPADTPFEVMVGAVLTQNTNWNNVERAIDCLRKAGCLDGGTILAMRRERLAKLIRSSGYFNVKARRLKHLCRWLRDTGGLSAMRLLSTAELRRSLLGVHGIGPETADDILLYALERPVFVIDVYTRRLFARLDLAWENEDYDTLRLGVERAIGADVPRLKEYHALIVRHAKERCSARRDCRHCRVERPIASLQTRP